MDSENVCPSGTPAPGLGDDLRIWVLRKNHQRSTLSAPLCEMLPLPALGESKSELDDDLTLELLGGMPERVSDRSLQMIVRKIPSLASLSNVRRMIPRGGMSLAELENLQRLCPSLDKDDLLLLKKYCLAFSQTA